jgi:plastocyanin
MMLRIVIAAAVALLSSVQAAMAQASDAGRARTVVVKMTDFAFKPGRIAVRRGDTIRFLQTVSTPHNVEFKRAPSGSKSNGEAAPAPSLAASQATSTGSVRGLGMGPFLTAPGETYEFVVDDRFAEGVYDYVCTPHAAMGMAGTITVTAYPR